MSSSYPPPTAFQPPPRPMMAQGGGGSFPPPPPRGGGFGRTMLVMMAWGAGISLAFAGVSALFGGRRTQEVHHQAPTPAAKATATTTTAKNPALTRPIFNCLLEESTLRQCLENKGDCKIYQIRVDECHKREAQGKL